MHSADIFRTDKALLYELGQVWDDLAPVRYAEPE
jgi:hypothetical protein